MTVKQLAERVAALEAEVRELKARAATPQTGSWMVTFGAFKDDPTFEEATRIGREWREQVNRESLEEFDREEAAAKAAAPVSAAKKPAKRRKADARS